MPAVPMIDDIELQAVQQIRQETDQAYVPHRIAGLDGQVHQKLGRRSHRVHLSGVLLPETGAEDLEKLQQKTSEGAQVTFTADITSALEVEQMVIESLAVEQTVGRAGQYSFTITLAESPPLPPPAELSPFGGLGDFGVGDLGFDPGALGDLVNDIQEQAGAVMDTLDSALEAVEQLGALANLANLDDLGNPLAPITSQVRELEKIGSDLSTLSGAVDNLTE